MSCRGRRRLLTVQLSTESLSTRHCLCDHKCITHVHLPMLETSRIEARIRKKLTTARSGLLCKYQLESHQHSAVHTRCLLKDIMYQVHLQSLHFGHGQLARRTRTSVLFSLNDTCVNIKLQLLISNSYIN